MHPLTVNCGHCGSKVTVELLAVIPPTGPIPKQPDTCPCPPPHKVDPDWQAAFVEADNARCKVESELEREREISGRFQAENQELERKVASLEGQLEAGEEPWKRAFEQMREEREQARVERNKALLEVKLLKENYARLEKAHGQELENHRMQLAAISTAANQNTETTINERLCPSNPYWTQAYADVCTAVDREMRHRRRASELEEINRKIRRYLGGFRDCEQENVKHPTPRK